ncbi:MAG: MurR/RpiR family transcriptional regulator [Treponemataceae bacterium]
MRDRPFSIIRQKYNLLSEDQKKVATFILSNKDRSVMMTISELAGECGLSETTVVRFINKLDYTSFQKFRVEMAQELSEITVSAGSEGLKIEDGYQDIHNDDSIGEIKKKVIISASGAIHDMEKLIDGESLERAVSSLIGAKRIMFYGAGGSSVIAMDAHHKFLRLGLTSIYESNSHFSIIRSTHLNADDVLVLISHTGESREVLECAENARAAGCTIIGLTSYINSDLAKVADIVLYSSTNDLAHYTDAMVSRLIQLVVLDMLFIAVSLRIGSKGKEAIEKSRSAIARSKGRKK